MFYKGKGNHGVYQLEELVEHFKEESYQKQLKIQELQAKLDKAVAQRNKIARHSPTLAFNERNGVLLDNYIAKLDEQIAEIGKG